MCVFDDTIKKKTSTLVDCRTVKVHSNKSITENNEKPNFQIFYPILNACMEINNPKKHDKTPWLIPTTAAGFAPKLHPFIDSFQLHRA